MNYFGLIHNLHKPILNFFNCRNIKGRIKMNKKNASKYKYRYAFRLSRTYIILVSAVASPYPRILGDL